MEDVLPIEDSNLIDEIAAMEEVLTDACYTCESLGFELLTDDAFVATEDNSSVIQKIGDVLKSIFDKIRGLCKRVMTALKNRFTKTVEAAEGITKALADVKVDPTKVQNLKGMKVLKIESAEKQLDMLEDNVKRIKEAKLQIKERIENLERNIDLADGNNDNVGDSTSAAMPSTASADEMPENPRNPGEAKLEGEPLNEDPVGYLTKLKNILSRAIGGFKQANAESKSTESDIKNAEAKITSAAKKDAGNEKKNKARKECPATAKFTFWYMRLVAGTVKLYIRLIWGCIKLILKLIRGGFKLIGKVGKGLLYYLFNIQF